MDNACLVAAMLCRFPYLLTPHFAFVAKRLVLQKLCRATRILNKISHAARRKRGTKSLDLGSAGKLEPMLYHVFDFVQIANAH